MKPKFIYILWLPLSSLWLLLLWILLLLCPFTDVIVYGHQINNNNNPTTGVDNSVNVECPLSYSIELISKNRYLSIETKNITFINENADIYFTVFLPEFDCQLNTIKKRDSLIYLNAIKYALNLLNNHQQQQQTSNDNNQTLSILNLFPLFSSLMNNNKNQNGVINSKQQVIYGAKIIFINDFDKNGQQQQSNIDHVEHLVCFFQKFF